MSDIYSNEWRWSTLTFGEGVSEEVAAPTAEYHPPRPQSLRSLDLGAVTAHPLVTPFGSHPRTRSTKPLLRSVSMSTDATLLDRGRESRTSSRTSLDEPLPTPAAVLEADGYEIYNEDCLPVTFGSLYPTAKTNPDGPAPRLVAFFLRVFMCGPCQDYVRLSVNRLDRKVLKEYNISVVVITMGSKEGLRGYRKAVKCPFPVFSDPTLGLYNIFGMHYGLEIGRFIAPGHKPEYNQSVLPVQMAQGFIRGMVHFPRARGGDMSQMGGEVVIGPGNRCEFIHRMTHPRDHMMAANVVRAAGCLLPEPDSLPRLKKRSSTSVL